MRVLVVDPPAYTPPYDDALCAALAARGLDVDLVTAHFTHGVAPTPNGYRRVEAFGPPGAGLLTRKPTTPLRLPLKLGGHLAGLRWLRLRARRERPDVVHWQWAPIPRLDLHTLRAVRRRTGACIFTSHDILPARTAAQVGLWREIYGACDRIVVHSEGGRDRLVSEVGVDPAHIAVIPHALFDGLARLAPPAGDASEPGRTILFFGLIRPYKGLDVLIEALPAVAERLDDVRLEVVGSPRMPIEPLRERASALGVADRIEWTTRFVDDAELAAAFRRASALALPYRAIEGSGVMATALAFGLPVVATGVGGFPELMREWDLGQPVAVDDAPALADALVRVLDDRDVRRRAVAGMASARAELTWERVAERTEALYRDALGGRA